MTEIKIKSMSKSKSNQQSTDDKQQTTNHIHSLLFALCLLTFTSTTTATIRYVSHTGSSTPPYTSWETAADSIQKAIDICESGDTVLVANGVYYENLLINTPITLLGLAMDSTVIDGRGLGDYTIILNVSACIMNFSILGKGNRVGDAIIRNLQFSVNLWEIKSCTISEGNIGIGLVGGLNTSIIAENLIMNNLNRAFSISSEGDNIINNCFVFLDNQNSTGIGVGFAPQGYFDFSNNTLIFSGSNNQGTTGISIGAPKRVNLFNNLISGYSTNIFIDDPVDTIFIVNNLLANQFSNSAGPASVLLSNDPAVQKNTALIHNKNAIRGDNLLDLDYNLFWSNINDLFGLNYGDSDRVADPMFVNDAIPRPHGSYNFHLQAYSPAIDAGDPAILDVDGSRSDIGMYGGPLGESYKYRDLAPKPPRNLSGIVDSNYILVKWNRNTEADTSHYNIYRDTVANFIIDSTKLISSQTDTFYIQYPPYQNSRYVYKITCVDNQGNESLPSEELVINITSLTMNDHPMTISDYLLYQNYPNPFNPSTTIAYKLKERAYVKLMVYDIKGELISVLVNKEQESGYYEVEFSSSSIQYQESSIKGLASGIYLYRIEVIGEGRIPVYSDMKKMLLVK